MRRILLTLSLAGAATIVAAPLDAQGRGRNQDDIPAGHRPPPGMCRVWINGVPPGQQPAPTDCATAIRNRPSNGRVIFGDEAPRVDRGWREGREPRGDRGEGEAGRHPSRMPAMLAVSTIQQGRRSPEQLEWLGSAVLRTRYADADGDGTPERIEWLNMGGQLVQVWLDADRDGRADAVEIYRDGKRARVIRP